VIHLAAPVGATDDDHRMQQSRSLRTRARQLEESGRYAEARPLLEESLWTAESVRGPDDPDVGLVVFDLAGNALETQDNPRSHALYERAIRTIDRVRGSAHPYSAMARSRIAVLDSRAGQRQKAEAEVRDALPLLDRALGSDHPWYLQSLVTLGSLRQSAGDLQQAEQIERGVIAAIERADRAGTMLEATVLNNLADLRGPGGTMHRPRHCSTDRWPLVNPFWGRTAFLSRPRSRTSGSSRASARTIRRRSPSTSARCRFASGFSDPTIRLLQAC
jgi:hypothetical protein